MKNSLRKNIIMLIFFAVTLLAAGIAFSVTVDRTASVSGSATVNINPQALLDDFRYAANVNVWNCLTGAYGTNASCTASYVNDSNAYSDNSLKLQYDVSTSASYAGYYSKLGSQSLSGYTTISFYVKGAVGKEFFKVELKNTGTNADTNAASVYVTDYLDGGVTTGWQKVTIPLHSFANISDWSSGLEFDITFENSQSITNGSATSGVIYIDNITFGTEAVSIVNVNKHGSLLGRCALGGNVGNTPNAYPTIPWGRYTITNAGYATSPYSMLSEYDVSGGDGWAGQYMLFGGGSSGWTAIPHNFNNFKYLQFYIRARSSSENPKVLKVEMADSVGNRYYVVTGITTSWQTMKIPLLSITSDGTATGTVLDKTTIKQLNFIYEKWRITAAAGQYSGAGAVYIDDILLTTT